uniref:NADH-ubiquinone oxidoreductase chain 5 n=1 Tax=Pachycephus smyrnensis TaxID=1090887 RepID=A0A1W6Q5D0_9HYME|nr:NADH dehydrogenase subunit 5 [Pachycephus smyrnensis]
MISLLVSFFFFFIGLSLFTIGIFFLLNKMVFMVEWSLINLNSVDLLMVFLLDWMSLIFMSFVLLISSMVLIYSFDYMKEEVYFNRFIMLIMLFVFSMLLMIMSPNLLSILLGWDGLGLISYCLVAYYQNIKSYNASMLTILMNRFGDTGLMLSLSMLFYMGSWNLILFDKVNNMIVLLFCLAALTKSAQIPFSSWLPAAMAAPTPISSLVHSSTLVTAGVYLLIRFNHVLMNSKNLIELIFILSMLTMFMAGISANWENDLKKIIALSTLSQLGLMMSILSLGGVNLAFFHLLTHAMFKALLFMCAGVIIHSMKNFQDIRYMGSMVKLMPFTLISFNISNLALAGMPFLAGFYSKDLILEELLFSGESYLSFILFLFSIGLTISYSLRMFVFSLFGEMKMVSCFSLSDENYFMKFSMIFMMFMSICVGKFLSFYLNFKLIYLPLILKLGVIYFSLLGIIMGLLVSYLNFKFNKILLIMKTFFNKMWFLFEIFYFIIELIFKYSNNMLMLNEKLWNEEIFFKNFLFKMKYFFKTVDFFYLGSFKLIMFILFYLMIFMFIYL